jgi:hypothetical protein
MLTTLTLLAALAPATAPSEVQELDRPTLIGLATLPADTFRPGPTSGQLIDPANDRTPPFVDQQPVQGISSLHKTDWPGTYLALSDNGFGGKANSPDYVLCLYSVTPNWQSGEVAWQLAVELSDPDHHVPWPIVAEGETYPGTDVPVDPRIKDNRLLTGADFDVESLVVLPDGTMWVGDEFGPFLLHFGEDGKLLGPPIGLPGEGMHSPDHPTKDPQAARIGRSSGFEGMIGFSGADGLVFVQALLERPIEGDVVHRPFWGGYGGLLDEPHFDFFGSYRPTSQGVYISEYAFFAHDNGAEILVLERDSQQAADALHKVIALAELVPLPDNVGTADAMLSGFFERGRPLVDLLNLHDPRDLDGDGSDTFRFPFVTIESVVVLDERTLLVCNDNNYPFSNGRSDVEPDPTEFILIRLPQPIGEMAAE